MFAVRTDLCDNGCFNCSDQNGGELHRWDLDDGRQMHVVDYKDGYHVTIFSGIKGSPEFQGKSYWVAKESWNEMIREEDYQDLQYRRSLGNY